MLPSATYTHFFDIIFKWNFMSKKLASTTLPDSPDFHDFQGLKTFLPQIMFLPRKMWRGRREGDGDDGLIMCVLIVGGGLIMCVR